MTALPRLGAMTWQTALAQPNTYCQTYDGTGNRANETLGAVASPFAYPPTSNRLSTIGGTARSFAYDAAGELVQAS